LEQGVTIVNMAIDSLLFRGRVDFTPIFFRIVNSFPGSSADYQCHTIVIIVPKSMSPDKEILYSRRYAWTL